MKQVVAKTFGLTKHNTNSNKSWVYEMWNDNPGTHPTSGEPGKSHWELVGYYGKLRDVAVYMINSQIKVPAKGFENAAEVLAAIRELEVSLTAQLEALMQE